MFCHGKLLEKPQAECDGQWQSPLALGLSVLRGVLAMGWSILSVEHYSLLTGETQLLCDPVPLSKPLGQPWMNIQLAGRMDTAR